MVAEVEVEAVDVIDVDEVGVEMLEVDVVGIGWKIMVFVAETFANTALTVTVPNVEDATEVYAFPLPSVPI